MLMMERVLERLGASRTQITCQVHRAGCFWWEIAIFCSSYWILVLKASDAFDSRMDVMAL